MTAADDRLQDVIRLVPRAAPPEGDHARLAMRLVEAMVFASAEPVGDRAIAELLTSQGVLDEAEEIGAAVSAVIAQVQAACADRGVTLVQVAGGWQFRTAPDLAPRLTRVLARPRRLPRTAMETLAVIAYHQPCTRTEIETIRGVSLNQQTLDMLLEASLIVPRGRKEVPGRPVLWGTSPVFLRHFGLRDLRDLPRREELLVELPTGLAEAPAAPEPEPEHAPEQTPDQADAQAPEPISDRARDAVAAATGEDGQPADG